MTARAPKRPADVAAPNTPPSGARSEGVGDVLKKNTFPLSNSEGRGGPPIRIRRAGCGRLIRRFRCRGRGSRCGWPSERVPVRELEPLRLRPGTPSPRRARWCARRRSPSPRLTFRVILPQSATSTAEVLGGALGGLGGVEVVIDRPPLQFRDRQHGTHRPRSCTPSQTDCPTVLFGHIPNATTTSIAPRAKVPLHLLACRRWQAKSAECL